MQRTARHCESGLLDLPPTIARQVYAEPPFCFQTMSWCCKPCKHFDVIFAGSAVSISEKTSCRTSLGSNGLLDLLPFRKRELFVVFCESSQYFYSTVRHSTTLRNKHLHKPGKREAANIKRFWSHSSAREIVFAFNLRSNLSSKVIYIRSLDSKTKVQVQTRKLQVRTRRGRPDCGNSLHGKNLACLLQLQQ